jgi:Fe-S cluster assembly ATP-binding protein
MSTPTLNTVPETTKGTTVHTLEVRNLFVQVETDAGPREILRGVDLTVRSGETHALMGPNGSGKSTLAYAIAGRPGYTVTAGEVLLDGESLLEKSVDARAKAGLFLAMQYPVEVPGVTVSNFLRTSVGSIRGEAPPLRDWMKEMRAAFDRIGMDPAFAQRNVNEGFSGGEKKRHEILQAELLRPKIAVLDETDSGLDVDALKVVAEGVNRLQSNGDTGVVLITHYTRILRYVKPDFVHVFVAGRVVANGGPELSDELEHDGYEKYLKAGAAS